MPSPRDIEEEQEQARAERAPLLAPHSSVDAIDWLGRPAHARLGGWKSASCILGMIVLSGIAYYGILFNLVIFLVQEGESNATAATTVATLSGTQLLCSFLGAFLSDAYIGRLWTSLIFQILATVSYILVGISVTMMSARGSAGFFLLVCLYTMVISTGPVLPNILGLGMDQLNSNIDKEKYFRLVAIATAIGQLLASTVITYIDNGGMWVWGFWLCAIASISCLALVAGGLRWFRHHRACGNPFLRNCQVIVAALRKHRLPVPEDSALLHECDGDMSAIPGCRKLPHTCTLSFLDKAAVVEVTDISSRWHLCTVTHVEELKSLLRVIPAGVTISFLTIAVSQISTLFEEQAILMNGHFGAWFVLAPASLNSLAIVSGILTGFVSTAGGAWLSDSCLGCKKQRCAQRATPLQLLGASLACCTIAMVISALVELYRLRTTQKGGMVSIMWLAPQTMLLGAAGNLAISSCLEFFYSETSDSMRSVGGCIAIMFCGAGSYLNSVLLALITSITTHGGRPGWIAENLDEGHADYFYWFLAALLAGGLGLHCAYAHAYKYRGWAFAGDNERA